MPSTPTLRRRAAVATAEPFGGVLSRTMLRRMGVDRHAVAREIAGTDGALTVTRPSGCTGTISAGQPSGGGAVGGRLPDRRPRWRERTRGRRRDRLRLQRRARLSTRCVQPQAGLGRSAAPRGPARGRGDTQPRSTACRSGARGRACRPLGVLRPAGRAPPRPAHPARGGVGSAAGLGEPGSQWPPTPSTDPPAGGRHHRRGPLDFAAMCRRRGLPEPDRQALRRTARGNAYLDAAWHGAALAVEIDGSQHTAGLALVADHLRQNEVTLQRGRVLRISLLGLRVSGDELPRPDRPRSVRAEMVVIPTVWARNRN
jgi:hypothetical protein